MVCAHCCVRPSVHRQTKQLMPVMQKSTPPGAIRNNHGLTAAIGLHRDDQGAEADLGVDLLSLQRNVKAKVAEANGAEADAAPGPVSYHVGAVWPAQAADKLCQAATGQAAGSTGMWSLTAVLVSAGDAKEKAAEATNAYAWPFVWPKCV